MIARHDMPWGTQIEMYHPDIVKLLVPTSEQESMDDLILIPECPNCGACRTMGVHLQQRPQLIVGPSFRDWCRDCREKLAETIDRLRKEMSL